MPDTLRTRLARTALDTADSAATVTAAAATDWTAYLEARGADRLSEGETTGP